MTVRVTGFFKRQKKKKRWSFPEEKCLLFSMLSDCAGDFTGDRPLNYIHFSLSGQCQGSEEGLASGTKPTP